MQFQKTLVIVLVVLLLPRPVFGHNEIIHQEMTDLAYQMMVWVERFGGRPTNEVFVPPGWIDFQTRVMEAPGKLRLRNSALAEVSPPKSLHCGAQIDPVANLPEKWWDKPLGKVSFPPTYDFFLNGGCGVWADWALHGVFNRLGTPDHPFLDHTGTVMGLWAASADRNYDDTHLWIRPTSVLGLGKEKDFINDAGNTAAEVILVPVICLFECIFGGCSKCKSDARKAADTINPVDEVEGWIPGVGDISGNDWVGLWHHINMNDGASNEFDAHQGELFEEAGPPGMGMDPVDLVLMAVMDATGLSVNYNDSDGVHEYQISSSPDGAALTQIRDKSQWQFSTLPHTPFEPVSNLAEYGWRRFFDASEHSVRNLAWPLHAIGDATVPMHVVATSAWGHRPYEDSQEYLWPQITLQDRQDQEQINFINRVMQRAFIWNGKILAWRMAHGNSKDVPVRDIVTELAGNTHTYSLQMQGQTGGAWPFSVVASTAYLLEPSATSKLYASIPGAADKARPLFEDGMGAIVALLVAASDSFPPQ
jgi:hypothetical protein